MGMGVNDRRTPPELFKHYDDLYHFTFDAAASHDNALCDTYCTLDGTFTRSGPTPYPLSDGDGLTYAWSGYAVWINPPYGRGLVEPFVKRAHGNGVLGTTIVMLLPVRTEQSWFQDYVWPDVQRGVAMIDWIRGRLKFDNLGAAPFSSMVVIWNG